MTKQKAKAAIRQAVATAGILKVENFGATPAYQSSVNLKYLDSDLDEVVDRDRDSANRDRDVIRGVVVYSLLRGYLMCLRDRWLISRVSVRTLVSDDHMRLRDVRIVADVGVCRIIADDRVNLRNCWFVRGVGVGRVVRGDRNVTTLDREEDDR